MGDLSNSCARSFPQTGQSPLVGDGGSSIVTFKRDAYENPCREKHNAIVRPPVINVDVGIIVMSAVEPEVPTHLVDVSLSTSEGLDAHPVIMITKTDLLDEQNGSTWTSKARYEKSDISLFWTGSDEGQGRS